MDRQEIHNELRMCFPSFSSNEGLARGCAAAFCAQSNPTFDELSDIKCAVSEAVTNAIVHGYRNTVGDVYMTIRLLADRVIRIEIRDKGCGIADVEKAKQPMFTTGGSDRSGMGFTIMESFMTTLSITSEPGKGTTVHMRRRLQKRK